MAIQERNGMATTLRTRIGFLSNGGRFVTILLDDPTLVLRVSEFNLQRMDADTRSIRWY